jgi:protein-disulfide isomerase
MRVAVSALASITFMVGTGMALLPNLGPAEPALALDPELLALLNDAAAPAIGPEDASITIVEFSDFQCPYCSRLAESMHQLQEAYPEQVRIQFRHFPLSFHTNAQVAAEAAVCAQEQGRFWEMHDAMFANQASLARENLLEIARAADVDVDALMACLDAGEVVARVEADQAAGTALGVTGTPKFFVNGVSFAGALPYEQLVTIVEAALAE